MYGNYSGYTKKGKRNCRTNVQTAMLCLATLVPINRSNVSWCFQKIGMKPCHMSCLQELKVAYCPHRLHYMNWMLNFVWECDVQALDHIFFSDEAWFHILGYINGHYYHTVSTTKPHICHELSLHLLKVHIWCSLSQDKIIRSIFFSKTTDSAEYQHIIMDFITNLPLEERYCYL